MKKITGGKQELKQKQKQNVVLVCVTDQFSCERLVRAGADIAAQEGLPLKVMSVQKYGVTDINAQAIEYLFNVTRSFGADMTVFYDREPQSNFIKYVKRFYALHIVAGVSPGDINESPFWKTIRNYNLMGRKRKLLLHIVDKNGGCSSYDALDGGKEIKPVEQAV